MGRDTGYWWSPDETHIAFTRIDDAPVQEVERFEINADGARMYRQRYPAAGTPNTRVELKVLELASRQASSTSTLRARRRLSRARRLVPDSQRLAVQRQTRDQKRLDLLKVDAAIGRVVGPADGDEPALDRAAQRSALSEGSGRRSSGPRAARATSICICYDLDGKLVRPLTAGDWMVVGDGIENGLVGVDESEGTRLLHWRTKPRRLNVICTSTSLDTRTPERSAAHLAGSRLARREAAARRRARISTCGPRPSSRRPRACARSTVRVQHWLVRNALDATHPYHAFIAQTTSRRSSARSQRERRAARSTIACSSRRALQAGKRYPVVIDTYGGPHFQYVRKDWMGGARAAQGYFRQVLAQHGFVVFTLDNRGSGFRGDAFESRDRRPTRQGRDRGSAARRRVSEDAAVRRPASASASWAGATAAT